ncbi:MAG: hypothetical protein AAF596_02525, partial [Planctomycetota bacterium]
IAAKLTQSRHDELRAIAEQLDTSLDRIVSRPCASAALVRRLTPEATPDAELVVAPACGGVDLVAARKGAPVLIRSTQSCTADVIQSDIRRTLPAASQLLGGPIDVVTVVGSPAEETRLDTPSGDVAMRVVDLANQALTKQALSDLSDADRVSFGGVIGAAIEAAAGEAAPIDFANPRGSENGPTDRRRQLVLGGVAAAAVFAGLLMAYGRLAKLDRQIADLQAGIRRLDESTETLRPYQQQTAQLEKWAATDVTWLDELELLGRRLRPKTLEAKDFPADEDVVLTELLLRPPPDDGGGGQMQIRGAARSKSVPGLVEERLRDEWHAIQPISVSERPTSSKYDALFQTFVRVAEGADAANSGTAEDTPEEATEGDR